MSVIGYWAPGQIPSEEINGLKIYRKRLMHTLLLQRGFYKRGTFIKKIFILFGVFSFFIFCLVKILKLKPDFVCIHNVELTPLAFLVSFIKRINLIYLPHELESKKEGRSKKYNLLMNFLESKFIHLFKDIACVCEPISEWYRDRYNLDNVHTLRNLPLKDHLNISKNRSDLRKKEFKSEEKDLIFIYQGLISPSRGIHSYVNAFKEQDKKLVLMGHILDGEEEMLKSIQEESNIFYKKPVAIDQIVKNTSLADCGLHVLGNNLSKSYEMSLPNKFFEYLHAGLPVIVNKELEYLAGIVEENNLGWIVSQEELSSFIREITKEEILFRKEYIKSYSKGLFWESDAKIFHQIYSQSRI